MFQNADAFDGDISNWDTSSVEDMSYMFNGLKQNVQMVRCMVLVLSIKILVDGPQLVLKI